MNTKKVFFSSNPSESFRSTTFQFCLKKVCLALQKFHKAQTTNTPPTRRRRISYIIKLNNGQRVDRQSVDSRSTVDQLSTDCRPTCRPTRWPTCGPTRRWDWILNFYKLFTVFIVSCMVFNFLISQ